MRRKTVTALLIFATLASAAFPAASVKATIQPDQLCWEPDIEFPVPCEEDD